MSTCASFRRQLRPAYAVRVSRGFARKPPSLNRAGQAETVTVAGELWHSSRTEYVFEHTNAGATDVPIASSDISQGGRGTTAPRPLLLARCGLLLGYVVPDNRTYHSSRLSVALADEVTSYRASSRALNDALRFGGPGQCHQCS